MHTIALRFSNTAVINDDEMKILPKIFYEPKTSSHSCANKHSVKKRGAFPFSSVSLLSHFFGNFGENLQILELQFFLFFFLFWVFNFFCGHRLSLPCILCGAAIFPQTWPSNKHTRRAAKKKRARAAATLVLSTCSLCITLWGNLYPCLFSGGDGYFSSIRWPDMTYPS